MLCANLGLCPPTRLLQGRGTGWAVWDGAAAAAKYLEAAASQILTSSCPPASILELGSGTGLAGLAAAAALRLPTLLTDLPEVLPSLRHNIAANPALMQLVSAAALDWEEPQSSTALRPASSGACPSPLLVLAADCVWLEDLVQPFVSTLELAVRPGDRALLAYQSRSSRVDQLLFGLLRRRYNVAPAPALPAQPPRGPIDIYWLSNLDDVNDS